MLILQRPWDTQPQGAVEFSSTLRQRPLIAGVGVTDFSPEKPVVLSNTGVGAYSEGIGFDFNVTSNSQATARIAWTDSTLTSPSGAITVITSFNLRTPPSRANRGVFSKYIGYDSGAVNHRSWSVYVDYQSHASNNYPRFSVSGNGSTVVSTPAGVSLSNGAHTTVAVYSPSSRVALFLDGVLYGDNTTSVPASLFNSSYATSLGVQYSTTEPGAPAQYCLNGTIGLYALLPYAVTDAEGIEISRSLTNAANYLLDPRRVYIPTSITSGGAYTLNLETGSYSFTGSDAVLLKNSQLTLDSSSYSLTGSNASLLKGLILEASSGTYTLSGSDASLLYTHLLSASSGTYTINGADATLTYTPASGTYTLNAESGTYLLTGSDVTFIYSGSEVTIKAGSWIRYRIIT